MGEYHDVIIIGAGMAGLAAANRLRQYGYKDVIILEARSRIGGRVNTKNDLGVPLDMGASWVCGVDGNPIYHLGRKKYKTGFKRTVEGDDSIIIYNVKKKGKEERVSNTSLKRIGSVWKDLMRFTDDAEARDKPRESLAVVFNDYLNEHKSELSEQEIQDLNYGRSLLENDWAGSIYQLSAKLWDHIGYILPGGQDVSIKGNGTIVDGLAKDFGEKKIRINNIVKKIEYDSKGVKVTTREDKIFEGKYVICTLPVGVLEKQHRELFPQGLSKRKIKAMKYIPMGKFFKTYLKFDKVFWKKNEQWINRVSDIEGRWNQFLALDKITKQPILLGLNQTDYAEKLERLYREGKMEEIKKDALEVLRGIYGRKVPDDCEIMVSDWIFDEFSQGAYSFTGKGAPSLEVYDDLAAPEPENGKKRIFFAGEATTKFYPATMHGAYMTGLREANRLHILDKKKPHPPATKQQLPEEKEWQVFPEQVIPPPGKCVIAHVERGRKYEFGKRYVPYFATKIGEGKYNVGGKTIPIPPYSMDNTDERPWIDSITSTPDDYF